MKYLVQLLAMFSDLTVLTLVIVALSCKLYFAVFLMVVLWYRSGGFDAWRPRTIRAFMINFDSYYLRGRPKIISLDGYRRRTIPSH